MIRKFLLILGLLAAVGILSSGCYESKIHVLEMAEYVDVILLDDDGLGTMANIR